LRVFDAGMGVLKEYVYLVAGNSGSSDNGVVNYSTALERKTFDTRVLFAPAYAREQLVEDRTRSWYRSSPKFVRSRNAVGLTEENAQESSHWM
jgi:hypothetical protein